MESAASLAARSAPEAAHYPVHPSVLTPTFGEHARLDPAMSRLVFRLEGIAFAT